MNNIVINRDWYASGTMEVRVMDLPTYHADLTQCRERGETVNHWDGLDRSGEPLHVAWVTQPLLGRSTLYAYEVQEAPESKTNPFLCPVCGKLAVKDFNRNATTRKQSFWQSDTQNVDCENCGVKLTRNAGYGTSTPWRLAR